MDKNELAELATKEQTFDEILTEFAKRDTAGFVVWGQKLEAAHKREIEILNKRLEHVVEDRTRICGLCEPSKKILKLRECLKDACDTELSCNECKSPCSEYTQDDCPIKKRWRKALEGMEDGAK